MNLNESGKKILVGIGLTALGITAGAVAPLLAEQIQRALKDFNKSALVTENQPPKCGDLYVVGKSGDNSGEFMSLQGNPCIP